MQFTEPPGILHSTAGCSQRILSGQASTASQPGRAWLFGQPGSCQRPIALAQTVAATLLPRWQLHSCLFWGFPLILSWQASTSKLYHKMSAALLPRGFLVTNQPCPLRGKVGRASLTFVLARLVRGSSLVRALLAPSAGAVAGCPNPGPASCRTSRGRLVASKVNVRQNVL